MPTYKNISSSPQGTVTPLGSFSTVNSGETVETYKILRGEWEKVSDEPHLPLTNIRATVTCPGSVSGLLASSYISVVAGADGIVVTANAATNPHGYELTKGVVVEIENNGEIDSLHFNGSGSVLVQGQP